jgi:saccharopepsin
MTVPSQAFIDASSVENPALSYGADGVLGFGFTRLSMIDALLNSTHQSTGGNLLYNIFLTNLSQPNFIAVSLQRSTDNFDDIQGTFSIGIVCITYPRLDLTFV